MVRHAVLWGAALFGAGVNALAFWNPRETDLAVMPSDGMSPRPTSPPAFAELKRRATPSIDTFLVAPDNTCGYFGGLPGQFLAPLSSSSLSSLPANMVFHPP